MIHTVLETEDALRLSCREKVHSVQTNACFKGRFYNNPTFYVALELTFNYAHSRQLFGSLQMPDRLLIHLILKVKTFYKKPVFHSDCQNVILCINGIFNICAKHVQGSQTIGLTVGLMKNASCYKNIRQAVRILLLFSHASYTHTVRLQFSVTLWITKHLLLSSVAAICFDIFKWYKSSLLMQEVQTQEDGFYVWMQKCFKPVCAFGVAS